MKMNSKFLAGSLVVLGVVMFSGFALAEPGNVKTSVENKNKGQEKREQIRTELQAKFCEKISESSSKFTARFDEKTEKVRTRVDARLGNWDEKRSERDAKLAEIRTMRDENFEEHFKKLEERAQIEEQKKAVTDFETTVRKAVEVRRSAIDTAIKAFRTAADNLIGNRKNGLSDAAKTYQASVEAAFAKAKSDCSGEKDPKTVRSELHASIQAARTKFNSDRQGVDKVGSQMQSLINTRQQAMEKAKADFKAAMEKARTELKKVFPEG